MSAPTFATLAPQRRWVGWQVEQPPDRKLTKVPYVALDTKAQSNQPSKWITRPQAEQLARNLPKPFEVGGIGIQLGMLGGLALGGVDLDTCRDAETGNIAPWAAEIIAAMPTCGEISPSLTGVKLTFAYQPADIDVLKRNIPNFITGKQFKQDGSDHPPGFEFYVSNRFWTVTEEYLPTLGPDIRPIGADAMLWLLREAGPAIKGKPGGRKAGQSGGFDGSRSAKAMSVGCAAVRSGCDFEAMCRAIETDPDTSAWYIDKGTADNQRELRRIWEKATARTSDIDAVVERFNQKYMVVNEAGRAVILQPGFDPILRRRRFDRLMPRDLETLYLNDLVRVGTDDKGRPIWKTSANIWLRHRERHQYVDGVTFDPTTNGSNPGTLNLWEGFAVRPKPGDWSLMRSHLQSIICDSDPERFNYAMGWSARMVQRPAEQGETAFVMKGGEGVGKGSYAKALMKVMGHHGLAISNARHLVGNFNGHLRDAVFLFADEALFAGDRSHVGVLKSLITEPYLTVEAKFQNAAQMPNFLHVMMASNENWVVPAALDARRFFVLEVPDTVKGDHDYFAAIWKQMEAGGYEAMLYDLLNFDLSTFNVRAVPQTEGLQRQRKLSLPTTEAWWLDCLERGYVFRSRLGLEPVFGEWADKVSTELLFASYEEFARAKGERRPLSREALGRFLTPLSQGAARWRNGIIGERLKDEATAFGGNTRKAEALRHHDRATGYSFGDLPTARALFCETTGLAISWPDCQTFEHDDEKDDEKDAVQC